MISINPIEYPRLIKRNLIILSSKLLEIKNNKYFYRINFNPDSIDTRLYYGMKLQFFIASDEFNPHKGTEFFGSYHVDNVNKVITHYLLVESDTDILNKFSPGTSLWLYETFKIIMDNHAITMQDLYENCIAEESTVVQYGETKTGKNGLLTGFDKFKLNQTGAWVRRSLDFELSSQFNEICKIVLDSDINKPTEFSIMFTESDVIDFSLKLDFTVIQNISDDVNDNLYTNCIVHCSNCAMIDNSLNALMTNDKHLESNNIIINVIKQKYTSGESVIVVQAANRNNSEPYTLPCFIKTRSTESFIVPTTTVNETETLLFNGNDKLLCDRSLIGADRFGEQRISIYNETIYRQYVVNKDINKLHPGYWLISTEPDENNLLNTNVGYEPNDIPGGSNDLSLTLNGVKINRGTWTNARLIILPRRSYNWIYGNLGNKNYQPWEDTEQDTLCQLITNDNRIFIGNILRSEERVDWTELTNTKHTHNAADINTDPNHRFVTDKFINNWNSSITTVSNTPWRPTVNTDDELTTLQNATDGWVVTVKSSAKFGGKQVTYIYRDSTWKPYSTNTLPVDATNSNDLTNEFGGSLVSPTLLNRINSIGIAKKINTTGTVINYAFIENSPNIYNDILNNTFFDLTSRTNQILRNSNNFITLGFNLDVPNSNSIYIGSNIVNNTTNDKPQTIIGHLIEANENTSIVIGDNILTGDNDIFVVGSSSVSSTIPIMWYDIDKFMHFNGFVKVIDPVDGTEYNSDYILLSGGVVKADLFANKDEIKELTENKADINIYTVTGLYPRDTNKSVEKVINISNELDEYKHIDEDWWTSTESSELNMLLNMSDEEAFGVSEKLHNL